MIEISEPGLGPDVEASVLAVLRSGRLSQGAGVAAVEAGMAELCGTRHAVACSSGTTALEAALTGLGIGPGDEVIVPALTFVASANAVLATGADVRLVDVGPDFCLDPAAVPRAVGPRTAALMPVHLYGRPADLDALGPIADEHGLHLVEDAAQAHGARHRGRAVGSFGVGAFSFYATKNLAAGEGGMVTTDDPALADRIRLLRNQGMRERYRYEVVGHNWRMTELAAAVLLPQLARYAAQVERRRAHATRLGELLGDVAGLVLPTTDPRQEPVWHQYTVRATGAVSRDALAAGLRARGIATGIYYPRTLAEQPAHRHHPRVHVDPCPTAEELAATCLSLPVHTALAPGDLEAVAAAVREVLGTRVATDPADPGRFSRCRHQERHAGSAWRDPVI